MKIYTNIVLRWDEDKQAFIEESSESYEYAGPVAEMKGGGESTQVQKADPWSEQQPYLKDLFARAQQYMEGPAPGYLDRYTQAVNQAGQNAAPLSSSANEATNFLLTAARNPSANPAFQEYLNLSNKSLADTFNQEVLPGLTSQTAAVGNVGSSRQGIVEALATRNLMDTMQRNTAGLTDSAYRAGLQATAQGVGLAPQTAQLNYLPAEAVSREMMAEPGLLQAYQGLIGGGGYGGTQTTTMPYESGGLTGAIGGAAAGAGVASAMPAAYASWNPWIIGGTALAGYLS